MIENDLQEKLKKLKLYGFIEEIQEQEKNIEYKDMSFYDRISFLVQKECLERDNKNMAQKILKAKLKQKACLEKVKINAARGVDKTLIQSLSSCDWIKKKLNILVTGASGSGKSFLVSAIAEKACRSGFSARYYRCVDLLSELCSSVVDGTFKNYLNQINKFHVIVIDDWALSKITETEQKYLFELVEARNESYSTVFVSQTPVSLWHSLMPNGAIADAIMDRIVHTAMRIELKGESIRKEIDGNHLDLGAQSGT